MAGVTFKAVNKGYDNQPILTDINLDIEDGKFVVVVGPSGCGKSTLLRLIAGLESPNSGEIFIDNRLVNHIPAAARDIAMVFQHYALYPHMTVFDNMAYALKMRRVNKSRIQQQVHQVASMLQLEKLLDRKPASLSGGQRQRVAIGRAIVRSPKVFLFDEPLSNLDANLRTEMRHEIKKIHQQLKTTCIYVTHDQTEALTMADKIVVLNHGKIEQVDSPRTLYQTPQTTFVGEFIGHYPMNFIPATIDRLKGVITIAENIHFPIPLFQNQQNQAIDDNVVIGIRPEHIQVATTPQANSFYGTVEFIDDLGADRLLQIRSEDAQINMVVRVSGDTDFVGSRLPLMLMLEKANIFCPISGARLGGWTRE